MNLNIMKTRMIIATASLATVTALAVALPAFALTSTTAPRNVRVMNRVASSTVMQQRIQKNQDRGGAAITARINSLIKLKSRIQSMKSLSDAQKSAFVAEINTTTASMNALGAKITSDTSTTSLKADLQSIAPDYRIYALVEPQISIISASDRIATLIASLKTVQTKLQTRIAAIPALSSNAVITTSISDITAKLTDAGTQSQSAATEVATLVPDKGDKTVLQSNTATLKDARSKIQTATKDLQAARQDAQSVLQAVKTGRAVVMAATTNKVTNKTANATSTKK
jgi:hypothetical protein